MELTLIYIDVRRDFSVRVYTGMFVCVYLMRVRLLLFLLVGLSLLTDGLPLYESILVDTEKIEKKKHILLFSPSRFNHLHALSRGSLTVL